MKTALNVLGGILILVGIVWILQGVNLLPGSFMSGKILYTYLGIAVDVVGAAMLFFGNRRSKTNHMQKGSSSSK
jgi:uncharacterized membrane protein HdeD (DUF308 family)